MNGKTKIILSSAIVIALCLCAVTSVTYSWFTDSDSSDIDITAGTVDVDITSVVDNTPDAVIKPNVNITEANDISITKFVANSHVSLSVNAENKSDIPVLYRFYAVYVPGETMTSYDEGHISIVNGDCSALLSDAVTYVNGVDNEDLTKRVIVLSDWISADIPTPETKGFATSVEIISDSSWGSDSDMPSGWQSGDAVFNLSLKIQAVQGDYRVSGLEGGKSTEPISSNMSVVSGMPYVYRNVSDSSVVKNVTIEFDKQMASNDLSGNTVKVYQDSDVYTGDGRFYISENDVMLSIKLSDYKGDNIGDTLITVIVPGEIAEPKVYSTSPGEQPVVISSKILDDGNTSVTFKTTHFSDFYISSDVYLEDENGDKLLVFDNKGVRAAWNIPDKTIILGNDICMKDRMNATETREYNLNLNEHTLYNNGGDLINVGYKGSSANPVVNIDGDGGILKSKGSPVKANHGTLCINDAQLMSTVDMSAALSVMGSEVPTDSGYTIVKLGKDVILGDGKPWDGVSETKDKYSGNTLYTDYDYGIMIADLSRPYGIQVTTEADFISDCSIYVNGSYTKNDNCPQINVTGGEIGAGIYMAGYAKWNITGGVISSSTPIEIRAGELNISGGAFVSEGKYCVAPNGNGGTTCGAAIAISQHTTKADIAVNITGGIFKGAVALSMVNAQGNSPADIDNVKVTVSGNAKFISTDGSNRTVVMGGNIAQDEEETVTEIYGAGGHLSVEGENTTAFKDSLLANSSEQVTMEESEGLLVVSPRSA